MNARRCVLLLGVAFSAVGCGGASGEGGEQATSGHEAPATAAREPLRRYTGLSTPESVLHDEAADVYLVSNIDGAPFDEDDRAFISRLSPEGEVESLKWIDAAADDVTLNAPKGMAIVGEHLYVADIDTVRVFERTSGSPVGDIAVPGATFLNDIAVCPRGAVYVTDSGLMETPEGGFGPSGTDAIYRVALGEEPVEIAKGAELERPNGIIAPGGGVLFVATFGGSDILKVSVDGATVSRIPVGAASLDGVARLPSGELLVSSWESSAILRGGEGGFDELIEGVDSPADFGFDERRGLVLVPLFSKNEVAVFSAR